MGQGGVRTAKCELSKLGLRLVAGGSPGHVTHSVLSLHLPAVSDLHLQAWGELNINTRSNVTEHAGVTGESDTTPLTFDLLCEFHSLGVC